jgi:hypothetical protein
MNGSPDDVDVIIPWATISIAQSRLIDTIWGNEMEVNGVKEG